MTRLMTGAEGVDGGDRETRVTGASKEGEGIGEEKTVCKICKQWIQNTEIKLPGRNNNSNQIDTLIRYGAIAKNFAGTTFCQN